VFNYYHVLPLSLPDGSSALGHIMAKH
jgi:hypothetical protein